MQLGRLPLQDPRAPKRGLRPSRAPPGGGRFRHHAHGFSQASAAKIQRSPSVAWRVQGRNAKNSRRQRRRPGSALRQRQPGIGPRAPERGQCGIEVHDDVAPSEGRPQVQYRGDRRGTSLRSSPMTVGSADYLLSVYSSSSHQGIASIRRPYPAESSHSMPADRAPIRRENLASTRERSAGNEAGAGQSPCGRSRVDPRASAKVKRRLGSGRNVFPCDTTGHRRGDRRPPDRQISVRGTRVARESLYRNANRDCGPNRVRIRTRRQAGYRYLRPCGRLQVVGKGRLDDPPGGDRRALPCSLRK